MIFLIIFTLSAKLIEIQTIKSHEKISTLVVLKDIKNTPHIVLSTQTGIKSLNLNGELEWYTSGKFCPLRYDFIDPMLLEKILAFKKFKNFFRVYIISLRDGKLIDSTDFKLSPLPQGIQYIIVDKNHFIIEARYEGREAKREHFVLSHRKNRIKIKEIEFSPVSLYAVREKGLLFISSCTPYNMALSRSGLSDYYPGIVVISPKTGKIITRYILPIPGYFSFKFYRHPEKDIILLPISPNHFTYWLDSTYIALLKIPELKEVNKISFDFKSATSNWIKVNDEYLFVVVNFKKGELYVMNENLEIIRKIKYSKEVNFKKSSKTYEIKTARIMEADLNNDKKKDIIFMETFFRMSHDPKFGVLLDEKGEKDMSITLYLFLNPFNSEPLKIETVKGIPGAFIQYIIEEKGLFIIGKHNEIKIYRLKWEA